MRLVFLLGALLLGLAQAQITYPVEQFAKALEVRAAGSSWAYGSARVQVQSLGKRLYKVSYQGPAGDPGRAGEVLAAALGNPQIRQAFADYVKANAGSLKGRGPVSVKVADGFDFRLELASNLSFALAPLERHDFGQDRYLLGTKGPVIRVFSDFECPFCRRFAFEVMPELVRAYVRKGQARVSYRHFPLVEIHPRATQAAQGSECAAQQGKFLLYHDLLFVRGLEVRERAEELGLDLRRFERCLADPATLQVVEEERRQALRLGLQGTPTVFVGPFQLPNAFDLEAYGRYLEMARALR
ncbi:DsbA family protein [Calidithermus chliarophilus]|uniref:DsbA family protein n=1 Tax=Calidithermus chliarophilus TaxID=52023 RepID=UPI00040D54F2|nr:thioredoxin domain-containing protein [Calidithermus chliarophilus]